MGAVAVKLREARALIERGWTQGASARTPGGVPVWGGDDRAVNWCAVSAICRSDREREGLDFFRHAIGLGGGQGIAAWNDAPERTQAEVLAAFDRAIELAEREQ